MPCSYREHMSNQNISNFLHNWKTEIISSAVILLCLFLDLFFPTDGYLQKFSASFFFLFVLPILYIKIILKKDLSQFGFNLQNKRRGFFWATIMLVASLLTIAVLIYFFNFDQNYSISFYVATIFPMFLIYELIYINFIYFINEFFFRGFVMFPFMKKLGAWSVLIQFLIFILYLISIQTIDWQATPLIIVSIAGGIVSYKNKSFLYSYAASLVFIIILDAFMIYLSGLN